MCVCVCVCVCVCGHKIRDWGGIYQNRKNDEWNVYFLLLSIQHIPARFSLVEALFNVKQRSRILMSSSSSFSSSNLFHEMVFRFRKQDKVAGNEAWGISLTSNCPHVMIVSFELNLTEFSFAWARFSITLKEFF